MADAISAPFMAYSSYMASHSARYEVFTAMPFEGASDPFFIAAPE